MTKKKKCEEKISDKKYCVADSNTIVLYQVFKNDTVNWSEDGVVPSSGGTVQVSFDYFWTATQTNCDGEDTVLSGSGIRNELIYIPPCSCEDGECFEDLVGEIEFKTPQYEGCNIVEYHVRQETCKKEEKK